MGRAMDRGFAYGETNERVIEFGKNMAMTLRAAALPAPLPAAGDDEGDRSNYYWHGPREDKK